MKVGYARVSTDKAEQDQSVDAQVQALRAAGCQKILQERRSAFKGKRKQWEAAKDLIQSGKVTHFMVCSLSRGSRQGENKEMSRLCKANGVEFIILDGTQSDVTTPEGLLMVSIFDAVNEADSLIKGMAVKRGLAARRAAGATGTGRCPFGYRYNGTQPEPDPDTWDEAKRLWQLLRDNEYIALRVLRPHPEFPFSEPGLRKWIANPLLMGRPRYSTIHVEPLVRDVEWHHAQRVIAQRCRFKARAPKQIHLFTQMVECQSCGRWMTTTWGGSSPKHRLKCMNPRCDWHGRGLAVWKVENQAIQALKDAVPQMLEAIEHTTASRDQTLSSEQIELQRKLDSLLLLQQSGVAELDKSIAALRLQLDALTVRSSADWAGWAPLIRQDAFLEGMTLRELRAIFSELIEQIRYIGDPNQVEITLRNPA